ncbi:MAG: Brp/Blh family beta-carotene 15,15'-dioxygenase [Planctomycetota bacterium]
MPRHSIVYFAGSCIAIAAFELFGFAMNGMQLIAFAALLIALLGVPHGGLDHWAGRRLLVQHVGHRWPLVFFPGYLLIAMAVAVLWVSVPRLAIVAFFVVSAWHFGREENRYRSAVSNIAQGGLVIWSASLFRPEEMSVILNATLVSSEPMAAVEIITVTRWIAAFLLPMGIVFSFLDLLHAKVEGSTDRGDRLALSSMSAKVGGDAKRTASYFASIVVPMVIVLVTAFTPILFSFTYYFCFWHSWLGLKRLREEEQLSPWRFFVAVLPLSVLAVALVIVIGLLAGGMSIEGINQSRSLQLTFIGLASIAVPHILLHEIGPSFQGRMSSSSEIERSEAYT